MIKYNRMVVISTQEQYVNYRSIMEHGIKEVFSIKPDIDSKVGSQNNDQWNKALEETLKIVDSNIKLIKLEIKDEKIIAEKSQQSSIDEFDFGSEPLIWNFTGGQKKTLFNCISHIQRNKDIREKDMILYIDGGANVNNKDIYLRYYNPVNFENIVSNDNKPLNQFEIPLNIKIALKLKSYSIANNKYDNNCNPSFDFIRIKEGDFFSNIEGMKNDFTRLYKRVYDNVDIELFESLFRLNTRGNKDMLNDFKVINSYYIKGKKSSTCFWGYILEGLALFKISELVFLDNNTENNIVDVYNNLCIIKDSNVNNSNHYVEDQLDIVVLTKDGKLHNIEVKSGLMTKDNAGDNSYTTYKTSGVYGKTILITPYSKKLKEKTKNDENEVTEYYKKIENSIKSGEKANMKICNLDGDINDKDSLAHFINKINRGENVH